MSYEQLTKQAAALREANIEIDRLQDAKRRATAIADERSIENVGLRAENERLRAALKRMVSMEAFTLMFDAGAKALMLADGCGLTIEGERVFCDDPRASVRMDTSSCICKTGARAVLEAAYAAEVEAFRAPTIDSVPSCGQENDWRNAHEQ